MCVCGFLVLSVWRKGGFRNANLVRAHSQIENSFRILMKPQWSWLWLTGASEGHSLFTHSLCETQNACKTKEYRRTRGETFMLFWKQPLGGASAVILAWYSYGCAICSGGKSTEKTYSSKSTITFHKNVVWVELNVLVQKTTWVRVKK